MNVSIHGRPFEVAPEPADFWGWVKDGHYDREWQIIEAHLQPEHTFLDLGAWVGSHSLFASTIAHRVVAVEPDPVACVLLEKNIQGRPNINWINLAVTGHDGDVLLGSGYLGASTTRRNPSAGGGIGAWEAGQEFTTNCLTIRTLVSISQLQDPLFIKMDVEGSEEDILQDVEFFKEHKPVLFLETHPFWWKDESRTRQLIQQVSECCTVIS